MRVILLVLCLAMVPAADALFEGFGVRVDSDEGLRETVLASGGPRNFVFFDDDGSGAASDGEPVFLAASYVIGPGDVWLTTDPGALVTASDGVVDAGAAGLPGNTAYLDRDGDGHFGPDDLLVFDQSTGNQGVLSAEDLILSGPDAGRFVRSGDVGLGAPVVQLSMDTGHIDTGDAGYAPGEAVVIDVDDNDRPTPLDILVYGSGAFGERLGLSSPEVALYLEDIDGPDRFYFLDNDGDGGYDPGDPIYLGRSSAAGIGSVRIHGGEGAPGSLVTRDDGDARSPRTELAFAILIDGSDDRVDSGERIYLDIQDIGRPGSLDGSDVILSGTDAGKTLDEVGLSSGAGMHSVSMVPRYLDLDGDRMYSPGDVIFYDGDDDRYVSIGDVQLVTLPDLVPVPVDDTPDGDAMDGDATDGAADGASDDTGDGATDGAADGSADDGADGGADTGAGDGEGQGEPEIPGFGWLAALLGIAFWVRRR